MSQANAAPLITTTPTPTQIRWQRDFAAPRELVFDVWTRPELVKRWFGLRTWSLPVCDVDLRPGGSYRWVMRSPEGQDMVMGGTYRTVERPALLVWTQVLEGFSEVGWRPEDVCLMTMLLTEHDGRTTWTATLEYPTQEARDAVLGMGMEFDRLDELLAELQ